ncbi:hypothetical protein AHF37_02973 [Paragonimus kellicotti]|nr:hypothetical protein AHF37_02973 [Paragonimus kellicotti]
MCSGVSEALGDGQVNPVDDSSDFISDDSDVSSRAPLLQDESSMTTSNSNTSRRRLFALSLVFLGLFGLQTYNDGSNILSSLDTSKNLRPLRGFASRHLLQWSSTEQIPIAVATSTSWRHSFMHQPFLPETSAKIGYILGFMSSIMYVSSRFPQILRNVSSFFHVFMVYSSLLVSFLCQLEAVNSYVYVITFFLVQ